MTKNFLKTEKEKTQAKILKENFGGKTKMQVYQDWMDNWQTNEDAAKKYGISTTQYIRLLIDGQKEFNKAKSRDFRPEKVM